MRIPGVAAAALASLATVTATVNQRTSRKEAFVDSLRDQKILTKLDDAHRALRQLENAPTFLNQHRRFGERTVLEQTEQDMQRNCDAAFLDCLRNTQCTLCFTSLQAEGVDWASVSPETPCTDVTNFLIAAGHCNDLKNDPASMDIFCNTFNSCVVWDDDDWNNGDDDAGSSWVDCDKLTECDWEGFHRSFIGDGICHDAMDGCYNTEVCGYDGGDCCKDTCDHGNALYTECGMDGYACTDPSSANCDPTLTRACPDTDDDDDADRNGGFKCGANQVAYRLMMYDSFGDGWDDTKLTLTKRDDDANIIFQGGLKDGALGVEHVCLDIDPTCYRVKVNGGIWGNEVSWEVKPMGEGTRAVADGGSPMTCEFSVAGDVCERTCEGRSNIDPTNDPDYKSYKDMYNCMLKTCVVQVGVCRDDPACAPCFSQDAPEFCFANDKFNAVIDCGICRCSGLDEEEQEEMSEYCQTKSTPGSVNPPPKNPDSDKPRPCSAAETLSGSEAVMTFSKCSDFDQVGMMITDFDENNFGALDTFEACAHSYKNEHLHGGKTALGCMQILTNAMDNPAGKDSNAPTEAISALAGLVYNNAEEFCECASKASAQCPLCPSFSHFKTLLYETLDACKALDEIDCDAWNEFYSPCKNNLVQMFGSVDFSNSAQCDYVKDTCGGAGPFPAFRKLDCNREIPKSAWDFYNLYARSCTSGGPPQPPPAPAPAPVDPKPAPVQPNDNNTPSSDGGSGGRPTAKPYSPKPDSPSNEKPYTPKEYKPKKKHRFLSFLVVVGLAYGAYWYYKRRSEFEFVQYRRAPTRNYGGESEMYSGLSMEGSTSFEPPTLPPRPSAVDGGLT